MAQKLAMVIDASLCLDCKGCMAACKVANKVPAGNWRNWIKEPAMQDLAEKRGRAVFQPGNCMQCDRPTCVEACPTGATYKDPASGVVMIDRGLCIGCGQCLPACPYGARYRSPELRVADKCDFCADRRSRGLEPACVSTCPTKARVFGDLNDPKSQASLLLQKQKATRVVNPKSDTRPNLYYLGDPGPKDWTVQAKLPAAHEVWRALAGPAVKLVVGLSGLGVLAMLAKQVIAPEDSHKEEGGHE